MAPQPGEHDEQNRRMQVVPFNANVIVTSQSPAGLRVLLLHPSDVDTQDDDWAWMP